MRQKLFALASVLSLLLCLATLVLLVRSYKVGAAVSLCVSSPEQYCQYGIMSESGSFWIGNYRDWKEPSSLPITRDWHYTRWEASRDNWRELASWQWLGFGYVPVLGTNLDGGSLVVPIWLPTLLLSMLPVIFPRSYLRSRSRRLLGLCTHCGYDLRATSDRCPECGMPVRGEEKEGRVRSSS
jgi:hypothetical protein